MRITGGAARGMMAAGIPDARARELEARVSQLLEASFRSGRFAQI